MDDMLEEKEMQEVAKHLEFCGECKAVHHDLSLISQKLKETPPITIPEDFNWKNRDKDGATNVIQGAVGDNRKKRRSLGLNWRTFSAVAVVLVISIALTSGIIEMGTIIPEESEDMMTMTRLESHDEEILWKDVQTIEDEEGYYIKQLQAELGQEIEIETSNKDQENNWHFTIKVNETVYKYQGKGGEIWIEE